ncbi:methionyl-tRNA synthetase [compost metagenome]
MALNADFKELSQRAFELISHLNTEINDVKPWELVKTGRPEALTEHLQTWFGKLNEVANLLEPVIPVGVQKLLDSLKNHRTEIRQLYPRR